MRPLPFIAAIVLLSTTPAVAQIDSTAVRVVHAPLCDTTITLARLSQLPTRTATISSHDGEQATYAGALLWDVLAAGCPSVTAATKRDRIGMAVRIDATDGYHAVVALMETDTTFRERPVLLCWQKNGQPLDAHDGPLQVIIPDDQRHARNVRNVQRLTVVVP
jgi:hypothetical protein